MCLLVNPDYENPEKGNDQPIYRWKVLVQYEWGICSFKADKHKWEMGKWKEAEDLYGCYNFCGHDVGFHVYTNKEDAIEDQKNFYSLYGYEDDEARLIVAKLEVKGFKFGGLYDKGAGYDYETYSETWNNAKLVEILD